MSHSSVSGVRSKSFIRLWISGKYSLEDVADCDVYFCGGEFLFPFFVAVNVWECDGLASGKDGDFFLGELGFSSGG